MFMGHMANTRRARDFDRLLYDLEYRLAPVTRMVCASRAAPASDRPRQRYGGCCVDRFCGGRLRRLSREVESRPPVILAIGVAIGALTAGNLGTAQLKCGASA